MQLSLSKFAALAALIGTSLAQTPGFDPIYKPAEGEKIPAGSTYEIVWKSTPAFPGTITIKLIGGATPSTLELKETIAKGVENSLDKYSWAVSSSLGTDATYGIEIVLDSNTTTFQYSAPFQIVRSGGGGGGSSNSTTASSRTTGGPVTSAVRGSSSLTTSRATFPPTNATGIFPPTVNVTATNTVGGGGSGSGSGPGSGSGGLPTPTRAASGANVFAAGSAALFGGLVMAALAL